MEIIKNTDIKRKALIIYCTDTSSGELSGPTADNCAIRSYLKSDTGGKWYDDEIISLHNPNVEEVKYTIKTGFVGVDYSFVVFSGHGCIFKDNNLQYIEVIDGDIALSNLITAAPRQTLVIDACRGYFSGPLTERMIKSFSVQTSSSDIRRTFNKAVMEAEKGLSILYSASEDESSVDTSKGGAYIYSLVHVCKKWGSNPDNGNYLLDVREAHIRASKYMKNNFITLQNPEMNMEKRCRYFPIAVNETKRIMNNVKH